MSDVKKDFKSKVFVSILLVTVVLAVVSLITATNVFAQEGTTTSADAQVKVTAAPEKASAPFGLIAAAIAFGFGAIGAGIAIGNVGSAAMGALSEKPELAGNALIFIALGEGLAIFGFITALMILGKI
jgi:V/A-type H+/Na+-transporting ATPase subunit K